MDPELDRTREQLSLILEIQSQMNPGQAQLIADVTKEIDESYEAARAKLADQKATEAEKKYAKDVTDAISKNLPNMTKAVLSAVSAFNSHDYINGSASIMDICASGAQMIGGLSAAAGPYGAMFGAVFSMISQLLTYFGPKQPSLTAQIKTLLQDLKADDTLRVINADGKTVIEYTNTINRVKSTLPEHLKKPLETIEDLRAFRIAFEADLKTIDKAFDNLRNQYSKWDTAEWLLDKKNYELERWPEALGVFCRVYSDSLLANMTLASMVDRKLVYQRLDDVSSSNPNYKKHKLSFQEIDKMLISLLANVEALPKLWDDGNELMRQFLQEIRPVAQDRGLFVHLGDNGYLYAATGRNAIQSDSWKELRIGYGGYGHRFSLTVPKDDRGSLLPKYHIFFCERWSRGSGGDLEHGRVTPSPMGISGQGQISTNMFSDVWALPAPADPNSPNKGVSYIYAAHDGEPPFGSVQLLVLDAENKLTDGNWRPVTKSGMVNVRAVTHPPATLTDDPDNDGIPAGSLLLGGIDHYNSIIYGALRSSSEIYVNQSNTDGYVPAPWATYSGIDVDPYYLWVFRPEGVACATHASVIKCVLGKRTTPRWMEHSPTDVFGDLSRKGERDQWYVRETNEYIRTYPPLKGMLSLSPCTDGTLYASIYTRAVLLDETTGSWVAKDTLGSYTTGYSIDLKAESLKVEPWEKCAGAAFQVQKMPIPCWSLFESLEADLKGIFKRQQKT